MQNIGQRWYKTEREIYISNRKVFIGHMMTFQEKEKEKLGSKLDIM